MNLFFILITSIFFLVVGYFLRIEKAVNATITIILVCVISGFVTYTPDWLGYEFFFESDSFVKEPIFEFLKKIVISYDGDLSNLHFLYISIYTAIMVFIISRFANNILFVVILYYPIIFIYYTTQIRFFLGYYIICLAFLCFYYYKNFFLCFVLVLIGVFSHYSVLLFIPFLFLNKIEYKKFGYNMIKIGLIVFFIYYFFINYVLDFFGLKSFFQSYVLDTNMSSFLGGFLYFLPLMIIFYSNYLVLNYIVKIYPIIKDDQTFIFLYKFAFFPLVYLFISFITQEIGRRFMLTAFLFQILILIYIFKYLNSIEKRKISSLLIIYSISYFLHMYYFTQLFNSNYFLDTAMEILQSNFKINI